MKKIGLTGGIASGKSTVTKIIRDFGYKVICADEAARELCEKGLEGYSAVKKAFGDGFFSSDGTLDRKKLGTYVFKNKRRLQKLNRILHPLIIKDIMQKAGEQEKVVFIDAALLIETGLYKDMDEVWLVTADRDKRIERLMKRDNLSYEDALLRVDAQLEDKDKIKYAKKTIDNSGSLEDTKKQVENLLKLI